MVVNRMQKIDELIRNRISLEIRELFPDRFVSVSQVNVSKDLNYAKVWISSVEDIDETVKLCQEHRNELRKDLANNVEIRKVPKLHFVADKTSIEADKIDRLIKQTKD